MSRTLSIGEARDQLMARCEEMACSPDADVVMITMITKHDKPIRAVLSYDAYEALVETIAVLSAPEMAGALRHGMADVRAGRVRDRDDVLAELGW